MTQNVTKNSAGTATALAAIRWQCLTFGELTTTQLYQLLQLRQQVFVVEQTCPYLDADGVDQQCHHLLGWLESPAADGEAQLVACARLVPPAVKYPEPSLGRVLSSESLRRTGIGRVLMHEALDQAERLYPGQGLRISAQCYLEKFYTGFGFMPVGEPYPEDDIPHIEMVRQTQQT